MHFIKLGIISVIVFSIMLLCFTAIMPSHVRISRAANMYGSPGKVDSVLQELKATDSLPYLWQVIPFDTITTVQLYYDFHLKWYPWEKLGSIVYDEQLGPDMERRLANIKELSE